MTRLSLSNLIKLILALGIVIFFLTAASHSALAQTCSPAAGGALTVSSSCSFSGTVNGVDGGSLTVSAGTTLTINAGQTIAWNPGTVLVINGSIAVTSTAQLKQTYLWMTDGDADGYSSATTQYAQDTAPASGRRRNVMTSISAVDCNDGDATKWQILTGYPDADNDTFTLSGQSVCSGASVPSGYRSAANGNDCNDADATKWQNLTGYPGPNADGDGYNAGAATQVCSGSSLPAGYTTQQDCYDSNASAYPGQTAYFTVNRGDGSFDYDCDGSQSFGLTQCYAYSQSTNTAWVGHPGSCGNQISFLGGDLIFAGCGELQNTSCGYRNCSGYLIQGGYWSLPNCTGRLMVGPASNPNDCQPTPGGSVVTMSCR